MPRSPVESRRVPILMVSPELASGTDVDAGFSSIETGVGISSSEAQAEITTATVQDATRIIVKFNEWNLMRGTLIG